MLSVRGHMTAMHHTIDHLPLTDEIEVARDLEPFDWGGQVRLGVVLSAATTIVGVGLAGKLSDHLLVVGAMAVASLLAWRRVDHVHA